MSFRINRTCAVCATRYSYDSDARPADESRCQKCQNAKVKPARTRRAR